MLVVAGSLVAVLIFWAFSSTASPHDVTLTRLISIEYRIRSYILEHGKPPTSLTEIVHRLGYNDSLKDGWGNEILYVFSEGRLTLTSFGPDGSLNTSDDIIRDWETAVREENAEGVGNAE